MHAHNWFSIQSPAEVEACTSGEDYKAKSTAWCLLTLKKNLTAEEKSERDRLDRQISAWEDRPGGSVNLEDNPGQYRTVPNPYGKGLRQWHAAKKVQVK
jgi:hypothetical protein